MSTPGAHEQAGTTPPVQPGIPPLPPDATPEQKDEHWFKHMYQGDKMPQLTLRAVLMGGILGMLMAAANLYTTLQIGWAFGIAITACVLSFVVWNVVRLAAPKGTSQMSILENACMASCASAAGYSTGSTIATMFGALVLLKDVPDGTPLATIKTWNVTEPWIVVTFTLCTGLMGVFLAIPMKRQQINHEQLPFPSGIAAAETLRSLYSASKEAMHKAYVLVLGLGLGLLIGFLRASEDVLNAVHFLKNLFARIEFLRIPEEIKLRIIDGMKLFPGGRHPVGFSFEPSGLLVAAGMIVGMRTSLSLLIGSALLYGVFAPRVAQIDAQHLDRGASAIATAVETATKVPGSDARVHQIDPSLVPGDVVKTGLEAVEKAVAALELKDNGVVLGAARRGAAGAMAGLELAEGQKHVEALLRAADAAGLNPSPIRKAAMRAGKDLDLGPEQVMIGAALAEAVRQAEAGRHHSTAITQAANKALREASITTDKEAGGAVLAAVLEAATKEGVDVATIRKVAEEASAAAKANPGREGAAAAKKEAVRLIYDLAGRDPSAIESAADEVGQRVNAEASTKVTTAVMEAIRQEAARLSLDTPGIEASAKRAVDASGLGAGAARVSAARERLEFEAKAKGIDAMAILEASTKWSFTDDEKRDRLQAVVQGLIGGPTGAAGQAGAALANVDAVKAREDALASAKKANASYKATKEAGDAAFDAGRYRPNLIWNWGGSEVTLTRWSLWGGTAVMVFASLMSVALQWKTIVRAFAGVKKGASEGAGAAGLRRIEVPGSWMVMGMLPITIAMVWLQIQAFGVTWYAGLIAVGMSFVLSLVASRATGETDTTPIGAMGKVMQLMFAVLAPKNIAANLASAGIAANSASSSADLLTDLKTGYLLGANPRKQFLAQFFGVFFGTVAIVPIWYLMVPDRAKLETFAMPATRAWEAVARVLVKGVGELPHSAIIAIFVGAAIGCILPVVERYLPAKARRFMPSVTGLGLAWVIPFQNAYSFFLGAVLAALWFKFHRKSQEKFNVPIASGLVAGESLMAALLAITATAVGLLGL